MRRNILLVANSGEDLNATVAEAAKKTGRGMRKASTTRKTFEILSLGLDDVDLAIVDVDPGLHSMAILEALNYSKGAPPVIALTKVDEAEAGPIVRRHGAAACIRKPFAAAELAILIDKVCASACQTEPVSCDTWGHPRSSSRRNWRHPMALNATKRSSLHSASE